MRLERSGLANCLSLTGLLILGTVQTSRAQDVVDLFRRVSPSVVVLHTVGSGVAPGGGQVSQSGLGSGVLIDADVIVTAAHVVQTTDQIEAEFVSGERIYAEIVASAPLSDLSLLRLEHPPMDVRPVALADSDAVEIGSQIFVVGAPLGLSHSVTVGHISARRLGGDADSWAADTEIFQTDAAINQGNSGGPMFDMQGEVIGIVSYILTQSGGFEGLGFAITSNTARRLLLERRNFWTGLSGELVAGPIGQLLNIPQRVGFVVQQVARNSPAQRAGLRPSTVPVEIEGRRLLLGGDIILAIDGITIGDDDFAERIRSRLNSLERGQRLTIDVWRSGQRQQLVYQQIE